MPHITLKIKINISLLSVEIFYHKNNPSKCICINIEKIKDFQYYMHIIWNERVRQSWKGGNDILIYDEKGAWSKRV
jgi:hypothetical protein